MVRLLALLRVHVLEKGLQRSCEQKRRVMTGMDALSAEDGSVWVGTHELSCGVVSLDRKVSFAFRKILWISLVLTLLVLFLRMSIWGERLLSPFLMLLPSETWYEIRFAKTTTSIPASLYALLQRVSGELVTRGCSAFLEVGVLRCEQKRTGSRVKNGGWRIFLIWGQCVCGFLFFS